MYQMLMSARGKKKNNKITHDDELKTRLIEKRLYAFVDVEDNLHASSFDDKFSNRFVKR